MTGPSARVARAPRASPWRRHAIAILAVVAGATAGWTLASAPRAGDPAASQRRDASVRAEAAARMLAEDLAAAVVQLNGVVALTQATTEPGRNAGESEESFRRLIERLAGGQGIFTVARRAPREAAPPTAGTGVALALLPPPSAGAAPRLALSRQAAPLRGGISDLVATLTLPITLPEPRGLPAATGIVVTGTREVLPLGLPRLALRAGTWLQQAPRAPAGRTDLHDDDASGAPAAAVAWATVPGTGFLAYAAIPLPDPPPDPGWPLLGVLLGAALGAAIAALGRSVAQRREMAAALVRMRREHDVAMRTVAERQGLETLGRLTAGVAHDMGNVMQAVEFYLRSIPNALDDRAALARLLDRARAAARRGATGARDLLALARGSQGRPEPTDVGPLLGELGEVMQELLGQAYSVRIRIQPGLPAVLAEAGDLEAMLINLATNARDAMAVAGGGTLDISAELVGSPDGPAPRDDTPGGEWVRIDIADTGVGMDAQTLERAMEPFFTTKPRGRGTGLGLALAREFAERSGGFLRIGSSPGNGTCVSLYLHPATEMKVHLDDDVSADSADAQAATFPRPRSDEPGASRHEPA